MCTLALQQETIRQTMNKHFGTLINLSLVVQRAQLLELQIAVQV